MARSGSSPARTCKTSPFGSPVHAFIGTSAELAPALPLAHDGLDDAANARFVARYNEAFADTVTRTFSPNSSYDAFYVVAYATYAIGDAPVTGGEPRRTRSRGSRRRAR